MLLDDVPDWVPVDEREEYLYRRNYQRPSGAPRSFLPPPRPAPSTNASTLTVAACAALPPDVIAHVRDEAICACMADLQAAREEYARGSRSALPGALELLYANKRLLRALGSADLASALQRWQLESER